MKSNLNVLDIYFHNEPIGTLTRFQDDRNLFVLNQEYINNPARPTLSLSLKNDLGNLITHAPITKTRLQPFFSNMLPEGYMRTYLSSKAQVNENTEFFLLAALGDDLPGALKAGSLTSMGTPVLKEGKVNKSEEDTALRFSLTGLQLKFSGLLDKVGTFTIPIQGKGGSWIIKLPSPAFAGVPQNEYSMMELARQIGINVPQTALIKLEQITGIPEDIGRFGPYAFAIQRFDRSENGDGIHIEDFAQVFGVYPEKKYSAANYANIAHVIGAEIGRDGLIEFIQRLVFNILIGNGDMHLKNWSLIYPDKIHPQLAPAYDYVSTVSYLPTETLALNFMGNKSFQAIKLESFEHFAAQLLLPKKLVIDTVLDTVSRFESVWKSSSSLPIEEKVGEAISLHLKSLPFWHSRA